MAHQKHTTMKYIQHRKAALPIPTGKQERRYFFALMLRSRGKKSLDLQGFPGVKMTRQGFYTFSLKNGVLLRNILSLYP